MSPNLNESALKPGFDAVTDPIFPIRTAGLLTNRMLLHSFCENWYIIHIPMDSLHKDIKALLLIGQTN